MIAFTRKCKPTVCRRTRVSCRATPGGQSFPQKPQREQIRELEQLLEAALKQQNLAFEYETVENFIAVSEVVEDLSYAYRRKREELLDVLEEYCATNPAEAECRTYDI